MSFNDFLDKAQKIEVDYCVSPEVYGSFQIVSKDYNPLHTQESFAKQKGFSACVMYGNILNCFVSHFVGMALPSPDVMIISQDVLYKKPVYLNDEIKIISKIDEFSEAVSTIKFKLLFQNGGGEIVAKGHIQIKILG